MKDALKWLAGGLGVYLLARRYFPTLVGAAPVTATAAPGQVLVSPTRDLVLAEARRLELPDLLSGDEWNWVYEQVRRAPAPDPAVVWPDRDRAYRMTFDEWWAGVSSAGLSGYRNFVRG